MGVDVRNFISEQSDYSGLDRAANTVMRNKEFEQTNQLRREARQSQTTSDLNRFFDQKDYLTGTTYDPMIVKQLNDVLQEGYKLTSQGMGNSEVFMALGPQVARLNEYSQKAKQISSNIKAGAAVLKNHKGYDFQKLQNDALKTAFFNPDGTQKDIDQVDTSEDFISKTMQGNEENYTTGAGIDELIKNIDPQETDVSYTQSKAGKTITQRAKQKAFPWQSHEKDDKGFAVTDMEDNPRLSVEGYVASDKDGNKFRVMNDDMFKRMMSASPALADYIVGQVNTMAKHAKKDVPLRNSEEWNLMARKALHDELALRGGGSISRQEKTTKQDFIHKQEAGVPLHYSSSDSKKTTKGILD